MTGELRAWYLAALGVVVYRQRAVTPVVAAHEVGAGDRDSVSPTLDASGETRYSTRVAPTPAVVDGNTKNPLGTAGARELRGFRLGCWQPAADLLVLDSLPQQSAPDSERLQLLTNILRAIHRRPESLPPAEFIDWPPTGSADPASARSLLEMFLQGRFERKPFRWVLVMGKAAAILLPAEPSANEGRDWRARWGERWKLACGAEAVLTPGLGDMIAEAKYKAAAWAALRFLAEPP